MTTDGFSVSQSIFNGKVYSGDIVLTEVDIDTNIYPGTRGSRAYEIVDHLGNVHAVISDRRMIISDEATEEFVAYENVVLELTDYYPFGMVVEYLKSTSVETICLVGLERGYSLDKMK